MSITYTWTFGPLETAPSEARLTDVIKLVHWQLYGTDDTTGVSERIYGSVGLTPADSESFIPFTDLTEDTVKSWVLSAMSIDGESQAQVELRLQGQVSQAIDKINNPPVVSKQPPWN